MKLDQPLVIILCIALAILVGVLIIQYVIPPETPIEFGPGENTVQEEIDPVVNGTIDSLEVEEDPAIKEEVIPTLALRGQVINAHYNEMPVTKFNIRLLSGFEEEEFILEQEFEDPEGRFEIPVEKYGEYKFMLTAEGYDWREFPYQFTETSSPVVIELRPNYSAFGVVIDKETREPIAGAKIGVTRSRDKHRDNREATELEGAIITNKNGEFFLSGLRKSWEYAIFALHPEYLYGEVVSKPTEERLIIELKKGGFYIYGDIFNDDGTPSTGVRLSFLVDSSREERYAVSKNGIYRSSPLPSGEVRVVADPLHKSESFSTETKWVDLTVFDQKVDFGMDERYATLTGKFVKSDGTPIVGGIVSLGARAYGNKIHLRHSGHKGKSNIMGEYIIRKIPIGKYGIAIDFEGAPQYPLPDMVFEEAREYVYDIIIPNTQITGFVYDGTEVTHEYATVRATWFGEPKKRVFVTFTRPDGSYKFVGIPTGEYLLDVDLFDKEGMAWSQPFVKLEENITQTVDIKVPDKGYFKYSIKGIDGLSKDRLHISLVDCFGFYASNVWDKEATYAVGVGKWKLVVKYDDKIVNDQKEVYIGKGETVLYNVDLTNYSFE